MTNLIKDFEKIALKYPNNIAYVYLDDKITYKELLDKTKYYSNLLSRQGNSPVIIYNNKSIDSFIAMISCIFSKRTYIMIDDQTPIKRINEIIDISNTKLIITDLNLDINSKVYTLDELKQFKNNEIVRNDNDICYIVFTSGSTGTPKGVPITYNNLYNFIKWISNIEPFCKYKEEKILNTASYSFDLSVADIFYSLYNGHTLCSYNYSFNEIDKITNYIKKNQINLIFMTPTYGKLLLLDKDFNNLNYKSLKTLYFCGEELDKKLFFKYTERFPEVKIINAYGPTEATSAVSLVEITNNMLNYDILPSGDMNHLACEVNIENDEIIIKGDSVFKNYLNYDSENIYIEKNKYCYKTGDLGFIKDNLLFCKGRIDNQIKYKGYRIELSEIENKIKNIPNIKECVVVAIKDNNIVKNIKAFVITDIEVEVIKEILKNELPSYMIPKTILKIDKIPLNKNGKIDRKALIEL